MPHTAAFAGIDIGGTTIQFGLANSDGQLVGSGRSSTRSAEGPAAVLQRAADDVRRLANDRDCRLEAVGVGLPGLVDVGSGKAKFLPNMPTHWCDVPVANMLSSALGCSVRILNDARCATLGEWRFGAGQGARTFALFTLGTGVGGGLVIEGRLLLGPLGAAGELGHQTLVPNGPRCGCGNRGCLEALASGPALAAAGTRLVRAGLAPRLQAMASEEPLGVTAERMALAADAGDTLVAEAIEDCAVWLGIGIANVVTMIHPERVVLGGGLSALGDRLLTPIRRELAARVKMFPSAGTQVVPASLGELAGFWGAIALARDGLSNIATSH
jgi:glucokinase